MNTDKLMAAAINLGRKNLTEWQEYGEALKSQLDAANAKLSERKTVHEWLTAQKVPSTEMGKPLCLLRRLRIAMDRYQRYEDALNELIQATDCTQFQLTIIDEALEDHKDEGSSESNAKHLP